MSSYWQECKTEVNHIWLSRYLNHLDAFIVRLERSNRVIDEDRLTLFLNNEFIKWETYRDRIRWLIDSYIKELSPAKLFDEFPLSNCSFETRQWLAPIMHSLWMSKYSVLSLVANADTAFTMADQHYFILSKSNINSNIREHDKLIALLSTFEGFRESCLALSDSISALPSDYLLL